jgi:hypothetical protein|tara:strand:- start:21275 stop:21511 length:237 start_codon:yes stop_codon:yes gene_type:complete
MSELIADLDLLMLGIKYRQEAERNMTPDVSTNEDGQVVITLDPHQARQVQEALEVCTDEERNFASLTLSLGVVLDHIL